MKNNMNINYTYMHASMYICYIVCPHVEIVAKHLHEVLTEDNMCV